MKALILNSGVGNRIADVVSGKPKCLLEIGPGTTILSQQIQHLLDANINECIVTTGPFVEDIKNHIRQKFPQMNVQYVHNPLYRTTNYIYSLYLARKFIDDDILLLHGDLVFEPEVLTRLLQDSAPNAIPVDTSVPPPEKDFKGRIEQGCIKEVGVNTSGSDCYFVAPLYKFSQQSFLDWLVQIEQFIFEGEHTVHAENALNQIMDALQVKAVPINGIFCSEIDTKEDMDSVCTYWRRRSKRNDYSLLGESLTST